MEILQIVTGERLQSIADVYIGNDFYFQYNPLIATQFEKQVKISDLKSKLEYNNPRIIFCYTDLIQEFSEIVSKFKNPFVLITHNSDKNITNDPYVHLILSQKNLIRWYSQNVNIEDVKLDFLPIGIANKQWPHGNLEIFKDIFTMDLKKIKTKRYYMSFLISTNEKARNICLDKLYSHIPFLSITNPQNNFFRLAEYEFCICPEGNGLDTHRLWECFYLKVIPIMLRSTFSEYIKEKTRLPMVLLNSWDDLFGNDVYLDRFLTYREFDFKPGEKYLKMNHYIKEIISL